MNRERAEGQRNSMQVGQYHITFDEAGAFIEHASTHAHYRVQALTATNALDFMKHHKRLIFAMMGKFPGNLEAYRLQQHAKERSE